jgi:exodeoxyribonuclease V gamma subunit
MQTGNEDSHLTPGLSILHSNHLERLRQVVIEWIDKYPLKPLENEIFVVQSNGMAQWLKRGLAADEGCGISAALDFQLPARFLWHAYRCVLGPDGIPEASPYDRPRLTWRLLRLIPLLPDTPVFAPLKRFLKDDKDLRKRYQLSCRLADLLDQYQVYRADWLMDWAAGLDQLRDAGGNFHPLPEGQAWQPELWRRIRSDIPSGVRDTSRSVVHQRFMEAAAGRTERPSGLPRRILVFGICSLPRQTLEALNALSRFSQVMMFVHNPCRHYWGDIVADSDLLKYEQSRHRKKLQMPPDLDPDLLHQHAHPLLAAWGKQGRDYIGLLYHYDQWETYQENFAQIDIFENVAGSAEKATLLEQVQQAILDLNPAPAVPEDKTGIDKTDQSICFHLAYNRQREVEILQDQLLALFDPSSQDGAGLTPGDIIVMTPDIEAYAPHIEAVFGNVSTQDARYLPFTIADRPESGSLPLLNALETLLKLTDSRMAVSDVLDLLEVPAFRNRFGLQETDLPQLHRWIEEAGIRWGLDAQHRETFDLPEGLEQNTWRFGLRRMLLGYAVGAGEAWQGIEPYDEIGGLDAALVGVLEAILEKLETCWHTFRRGTNAREWHDRILKMLQDFFLPSGPQDYLTLGRLETVLTDWLGACEDAALEEPLVLSVVRDAIMEGMTDLNRSQRFLAGKVNCCTLMPMRAIPFRVVCLLGMNDGDYPRSRPPLDFDLMSRPGQYRPGDRSRREDDRYLFLEALLSAREKLYISWIGRSVRDNSIRVPSVLVGQLRDYLSAGWRVGNSAMQEKKNEESFLEHITTLHPLQPFSRAYFRADAETGLFTYAHEWREIHEYCRENRNGAADALLKVPEVLPPPVFEGSLTLQHLIRFLKKPVPYFFNQRLKVYFDEIDNIPEDQEPFSLDSLAPFNLGGQLLEAGLSAASENRETAIEQAADRLRRNGDLPIRNFGEMALARLRGNTGRMLEHFHAWQPQWPQPAEPLEIFRTVPIDGWKGEALEDRLDGLYTDHHNGYVRWEWYHGNLRDDQNGALKPYGLIGLWVKHLAGCAHGWSLASGLIAPDGVAFLRPLDRETAGQYLTEMIQHWWLGLQTPLPIAARTALVYCRHRYEKQAGHAEAGKEARKAYQGDGRRSKGEVGYTPFLARVYPDFDHILAVPCIGAVPEIPAVNVPSSDASSPVSSRFAELARTLYAPLLSAIEESPFHDPIR